MPCPPGFLTRRGYIHPSPTALTCYLTRREDKSDAEGTLRFPQWLKRSCLPAVTAERRSVSVAVTPDADGRARRELARRAARCYITFGAISFGVISSSNSLSQTTSPSRSPRPKTLLRPCRALPLHFVGISTQPSRAPAIGPPGLPRGSRSHSNVIHSRASQATPRVGAPAVQRGAAAQ